MFHLRRTHSLPRPRSSQGKPRGRVMHPVVKDRLKAYYRSSNLALQQVLGKGMSWFEPEV